MNGSIKLKWSDVWLLVAIHLSDKGKGASLQDIISSADAINHAILNYEELVSGLFRLNSADMIQEINQQKLFQCTPKALADIEPISKKQQNTFQIRKDLEAALNIEPWMPKEKIPHPDNVYEYPGITFDVYMEAVDKYLISVKRGD